MSSAKPVLVVAGIGAGGGTGGATARAFAKEGYSIALIARGSDSLNSLAEELKASGANAVSFPIASYSASDVASAFTKIRSHFPRPEYSIRAGLYNAGHGVWKPFLDITPEDVAIITQTNIEGSFAFSREVLLDIKENPIDATTGKRGILIFTGATASIRGNLTTSAFAAGKFALRALSQSLAKEFGKQNIHVAHAIIDGGKFTSFQTLLRCLMRTPNSTLTGILTPLSRTRRNNPEWEQNEDLRLSPESIAASYIYLAKQDRSAWTWELDLRPAHEKW